MPSTRNLNLLPGIDRLRALCQSLALLDAILCPDWEGRYYSFNARWTPGCAMASMRDGQGDAYFLLFSSAGAALKGFAHESPMSPYASDPPRVWPGVLDAVPSAFADFLAEPAFSMQDTTFCLWRGVGDTAWQRGPIAFPEGPDPDGSAQLLAILDDDPKTYRTFAEPYYECPVSLAAVRRVYAHEPLTPALVARLNEDVTLDDLEEDLDEIQYPVAAR